MKMGERPEMSKCNECGTDSPRNRGCSYCGETLCESHWSLHMTQEKGNERLADGIARLWRHEHPLGA